MDQEKLDAAIGVTLDKLVYKNTPSDSRLHLVNVLDRLIHIKNKEKKERSR